MNQTIKVIVAASRRYRHWSILIFTTCENHSRSLVTGTGARIARVARVLGGAGITRIAWVLGGAGVARITGILGRAGVARITGVLGRAGIARIAGAGRLPGFLDFNDVG